MPTNLLTRIAHRPRVYANVLKARLELVWLSGLRYSCPVCGGHFRAFKTFVGSYYVNGALVDHTTKDAICPRCGSDVRQRFLAAFLKQNTDVFDKPCKLLDFAPNRGLHNFMKRHSNVDYITCDIVPQAYPHAVGMLKIDITNIELPSNIFDALICFHVLEHIVEDQQAISELYRILKPGAWGVISLPIYGQTTLEFPDLDADGRTRMYGIAEHVRLNGLDIANKLTAAGFAVDIISMDSVKGNWLDRTVSSPHIESDKTLFFCHKLL